MISHKNRTKTYKTGMAVALAVVAIVFGFVLCMNANASEGDANAEQGYYPAQGESTIIGKESSDFSIAEEDEEEAIDDLEFIYGDKSESLDSSYDSKYDAGNELFGYGDEDLDFLATENKEETFLGGSPTNYLEFYSAKNPFRLDLDYLNTDGSTFISTDATN